VPDLDKQKFTALVETRPDEHVPYR